MSVAPLIMQTLVECMAARGIVVGMTSRLGRCCMQGSFRLARMHTAGQRHQRASIEPVQSIQYESTVTSSPSRSQSKSRAVRASREAESISIDNLALAPQSKSRPRASGSGASTAHVHDETSEPILPTSFVSSSDRPNSPSHDGDEQLVLPQTTNGITLRPYQEDCLKAISDALDNGLSRLGVSSPTGSGKTTIFGELISRVRAPSTTQHRVIILVSSVQLAVQTAAHVTRRYPNLWVEIEQGQKYQAGGHADVTVATWQTLMSVQSGSNDGMDHLRLEKFDPSTFKAVIVDEAHHAASRSWRVILNHFDSRIKVDPDDEAETEDEGVKTSAAMTPARLTSSSPTPPIIGFSATFSRHDGLSLGAVFEEIIFHRDVLDLIDEAWLSPLRFTSIQANVPLDSVSVSGHGRDFNTTSLSRVINTEPINRLIVRSWLAKAKQAVDAVEPEEALPTRRLTAAVPDMNAPMRTRTLVFAVDIQHVEDLTNEFRKMGIDARLLTSATPMLERKQLLQDFSDGVFPVLVNCSILTEGADIPSIDCVLLARPTLSRNLFSQMIGRGMRLSPQTGKKDCLILDLVGNCSKGLVCTPTLFGLDPTEAVADMDTAEMLERRRKKLEREGELDQHDIEAKAWRTPILSKDVQDPEKVTFTEYDSAESLQKAMSAKALFSASVNSFSSNCWIDCGDDVFVVDIPPNRGYVRVERIDGLMESGNLVTSERDMTDDIEGEMTQSKGWNRRQMQTGWETKQAEYMASFTERLTGTNTDDAVAAAKSGPGRWRGVRRSPYKRARKFLEADTLEQAIRGSDTYIAMQILRSTSLMRGVMSRFAPWRSAPASALQRAYVANRLGVQRHEHGDDRDARRKGHRKTNSQKHDQENDPLKGLTKGEASIILTRLNHGAKARWQREVKRQNKEVKAQRTQKERREREVVRVGKLPR